MKERSHSIFNIVKKFPKPVRYGIYGGLAAIGVGGTVVGARAAVNELRSSDDQPEPQRVEREINSRNFLEQPFPADPNMEIQASWFYENDNFHGGIDYIKGTLDRSSTWQQFPVFAAARGKACANPPRREGNAVLIEHRVAGERFSTYYGHLAEIEDDLPDCDGDAGIEVEKGQRIGTAGSTGAENPRWVHLHFQVNGSEGRTPLDPYDLRAKRAEYPDPNLTNGKTCGENHLWINCPTERTVEVEPTATPESRISGDNLLADPSFEAGNFGNFWYATSVVDNSDAHTGSLSLHLTVTFDNNRLSELGMCKPSPYFGHSYGRFYGGGFSPSSRIQLSPGIYEFGLWVKAIKSRDEVDLGVGVNFFPGEDEDLKLARYPDFPNDWTKYSIFIQVLPEVEIPSALPSVSVTSSLLELPCGTTMDIWFDDIFLVPVSSPQGEVHVLNDPQAEEKFLQRLLEASKPLVERARALVPKMIPTGDVVADLAQGNIALYLTEKADPFQGFLRALGVLVGQYNVQKDTAPATAEEFLGLAQEVCFLMKEYFPQAFEGFTQLEGYSIINNPNCEFR